MMRRKEDFGRLIVSSYDFVVPRRDNKTSRSPSGRCDLHPRFSCFLIAVCVFDRRTFGLIFLINQLPTRLNSTREGRGKVPSENGST